MLGFAPLGGLPLGGVPESGAVSHSLTVTANIDVSGPALKEITHYRRALADVAASLLTPIDRVIALIASSQAGASLVRKAGKIAVATAEASGSIGRAIFAARTALVDVSGSVLRAQAVTLVAARVSVAGVAIKNVAKSAVARVTAFAGLITEAFNIISRRVLHDPVDYFMEGLPQYREKGRTYEPSRGRPSEDVKVMASGKRRLTLAKPSFTTKTDKRGYD